MASDLFKAFLDAMGPLVAESLRREFNRESEISRLHRKGLVKIDGDNVIIDFPSEALEDGEA